MTRRWMRAAAAALALGTCGPASAQSWASPHDGESYVRLYGLDGAGPLEERSYDPDEDEERFVRRDG